MAGTAATGRWWGMALAVLTAAALSVFSRAAQADAILQAVADDLPPYAIDGSEDHPGFLVELVTEAARRQGQRLSIRFEPWSRAQRDVIVRNDSLIIGLSRVPSREADFTWIADLCDTRMAFFTLSSRAPINSFDDALMLRDITVRASTPFEEALGGRGFFHMSIAQSEETSARKLFLRRSEAWLTMEARAPYVWRRLGYRMEDLTMGTPLDELHLYLAAGRHFPARQAEELALRLAELRADGTYQRLSDFYLSPASK